MQFFTMLRLIPLWVFNGNSPLFLLPFLLSSSYLSPFETSIKLSTSIFQYRSLLVAYKWFFYSLGFNLGISYWKSKHSHTHTHTLETQLRNVHTYMHTGICLFTLLIHLGREFIPIYLAKLLLLFCQQLHTPDTLI